MRSTRLFLGSVYLLISHTFAHELSCPTDQVPPWRRNVRAGGELQLDVCCWQRWMDERSLTLSVSFCSKMHDVWIWGWPEPLHWISGHSRGPGNRVYHRNGKSALDSMVKNILSKTSVFWRMRQISLPQILHYPRLKTDASRKKLNFDFALPRLRQNSCILLHVGLKQCLKSLSSS